MTVEERVDEAIQESEALARDIGLPFCRPTPEAYLRLCSDVRRKDRLILIRLIALKLLLVLVCALALLQVYRWLPGQDTFSICVLILVVVAGISAEQLNHHLQSTIGRSWPEGVAGTAVLLVLGNIAFFGYVSMIRKEERQRYLNITRDMNPEEKRQYDRELSDETSDQADEKPDPRK